MRKVLLLTVMCIALFSSAIHITVSGTVVTETGGLGLPGVSVTEKGTMKGTLTDSDGKFSIEVGSPNFS